MRKQSFTRAAQKGGKTSCDSVAPNNVYDPKELAKRARVECVLQALRSLVEGTMGHHYVPRKLLRNFAVLGEPKFIIMYDKQQACFRRVSIKRAAQEPEFYDVEVEKMLAEAIESPANPIIEKLIQGKGLTDSERTQLSIYIAIMLRRVPRARRKSTARIPDVLQSTIDEMKQEIHELADAENSPTEKRQRWLGEVDRLHKEFAKNTPGQIVEQIRTPWVSERMVTGIYDMRWNVVTSTSNTFVTGDAPVHIFDAFGIGRPESEFTFPLSPHVALLGDRQDRPRSLIFRDATQPIFAHELNVRMVDFAERFIYSHIEQPWLAGMLTSMPAPQRFGWQV